MDLLAETFVCGAALSVADQTETSARTIESVTALSADEGEDGGHVKRDLGLVLVRHKRKESGSVEVRVRELQRIDTDVRKARVGPAHGLET